MKSKVIGPLTFEECTVGCEKFISVMEDTALYHIHAGTIFQLGGAPPHSFHCVHAFLDGVSEEGAQFPDPSISISYSHRFFLLGVCKRHCLRRKG
jgi:hypothetical protein